MNSSSSRPAQESWETRAQAHEKACPTPASHRKGDVLAGGYRVERWLGEGRKAYVLEVIHLGSGRREALKLLKPGLAVFDLEVAAFVEEGRAATGVKSEHLLNVCGSGALGNGERFIALEYPPGDDLATILAQSGPLSVRAAVQHVREACAGLTEAQARGFAHRDITPADLFLARPESGPARIKVLDFGIANEVEPTLDPEASGGTPIRALHYMSPEQLAAKVLDQRSWVWAIGAVLHELITGSRAFDGNSISEMRDLVMDSAATRASVRARGLRPALEAVILRCLEPDPTKRYATTSELSVALAPFEATSPVPRRMVILGMGMVSAGALVGAILVSRYGSSTGPLEAPPIAPTSSTASGVVSKLEAGAAPPPAATASVASEVRLAPRTPARPTKGQTCDFNDDGKWVCR